MLKQLNKIRRMIYLQVENINKENEVMQRNQIEILEVKSTITKMKYSLMGISSRFE